MRIYVPSPVPLTPRERAARGLRFIGRCVSMALAGTGVGVLLLQFGFAVAAAGEMTVAVLGGF